MVAAILAVAFLLFGVSIWSKPGLRLSSYPGDAAAYLEQEGLLDRSHRIAHQDFVGNYLELRYGTRASVFVDDRYDMYPADVSRDYRRLLGARPETQEILDRREVDVVLWVKDHPLTNLLLVSNRWREVYADDDWIVLRPNP